MVSKNFRAFWLLVGIIPVMLVSIVLFIPTLGHSWSWIGRYELMACKIMPDIFSMSR